MARSTRNGFEAALVLALAACGGGGASPSAEVVVDTVEGVERWTYGASPAAELAWTADTVALIGDALGEEEYQFGSLAATGVRGDARGHVLALDRQGARILEYGPDGRHVATYGRKGGGPGELQFPGELEIGPGDTIWVTDFMNRRLTGYPRGGGDPRVVPYPDAGTFPSSKVAALPGGFLQTVGTFGPPDGEEEERGEPLIRYDAMLQPLDTLWTAPPEPTDVVELNMGERRLMMMLGQQFWPGFTWWARSDGSVVVSDTAEYLIRIVGPDGAVRQVIRRDPPARATTEADREAFRRRTLAEADSGGGITLGSGGPDAATQRRMAEERLEKTTYAPVIPRIRGIRVDPADRIWVAVTADEDAFATARIDLYDADGTLLGEIRGMDLPAGFAGTDRLLSVRTDELGVAQVVVRRVPELAWAGTATGSRDARIDPVPGGGHLPGARAGTSGGR